MNNTNFLSFYPSDLNAQYKIGILFSLIIHAGLMLIILLVPTAKFNSHPQIIHVSIYNQSELSVDSRSMSAATSIKSEKAVRKENFKTITVQPAHKDISQEATVLNNSEIIVTKKTLQDERPSATQSQNTAVLPATSVGNQGISQISVLSINKGNVQQGVIESKFGDRGSPAFIHQEIPVYPILARRLGKEGRVILKLLIDENGKLRNIEVVEAAGFGFTEAAIEAVKKSTYAPGYRNGEGVLSKALLPVRFHLQ